MDFENSKTKQNIKNSFIGESQVRNKYSFYAQKAREESLEDVAELFEQLAENEKEHSKVWYKLLNSGFNDTIKNLQEAASMENQEWKHMYPRYAKEAKQEGFEDIAIMFERIASIEYSHERKFNETILRLLNKQDPLIVKDKQELEEKYQCVFCGYNQKTKFEICPVCGSKI